MLRSTVVLLLALSGCAYFTPQAEHRHGIYHRGVWNPCDEGKVVVLESATPKLMCMTEAEALAQAHVPVEEKQAPSPEARD